MPLQTDTWTVEEALADIDEQIDEIAADLEDLDAGTDRYEALVQRADRLEYQANGLVWMRDEAEWGDYEVELGALTAGEQARMHREAPDDAVGEEMRLWFVAAGSVSGPHVGDSLAATFRALAADAHDGFVQWAEARLNSLSTPGNAKRRLRTSLSERQTDATSASAPGSTTSSSSASHTD